MIPHFFPSDPRDYLKEELEARQRRRPQYSLRAFARDLEISPSFLSEFLSGRQGMSRERSVWVSRKIGLSQDQTSHFWELLQAKFGRCPQERKAASVRADRRAKNTSSRLSVERFKVIADWHHFALLELLSLPDRVFSRLELARLLRITEIQVDQAIQRLMDLDMVTALAGDRFQVNSEVTISGDEGANEALRRAHQQMLEYQIVALENKPMEERESLAVTLSVASSQWAALRSDLKSAVLSVLTRYSSTEDKKDQVVCLNLQAITLIPEQTDRN